MSRAGHKRCEWARIQASSVVHHMSRAGPRRCERANVRLGGLCAWTLHATSVAQFPPACSFAHSQRLSAARDICCTTLPARMFVHSQRLGHARDICCTTRPACFRPFAAPGPCTRRLLPPHPQLVFSRTRSTGALHATSVAQHSQLAFSLTPSAWAVQATSVPQHCQLRFSLMNCNAWALHSTSVAQHS